MKATGALTSVMAPDIERYLSLKQALGREYDGVRRVLAHVDHFVTAHGGDLWPQLIGPLPMVDVITPFLRRCSIRAHVFRKSWLSACSMCGS